MSKQWSSASTTIPCTRADLDPGALEDEGRLGARDRVEVDARVVEADDEQLERVELADRLAPGELAHAQAVGGEGPGFEPDSRKSRWKSLAMGG